MTSAAATARLGASGRKRNAPEGSRSSRTQTPSQVWCAYALAQLCMILPYRQAEASLLAPRTYLAFGASPAGVGLVGIAIIVRSTASSRFVGAGFARAPRAAPRWRPIKRAESPDGCRGPA